MADNQNLFDQAVAAAKQKDFASARTLLKQLLKQDPTNLNAAVMSARCRSTRTTLLPKRNSLSFKPCRPSPRPLYIPAQA
jgi:thioredoxin-like negative regulator of GroEL